MSLPDEIRFYAPWNGVVTDNKDPKGKHRVKIRVPGLIAETDWARPRTMGGGSPQRGGHITPDIGADVVVEFVGGDPNHPIYSGAWWGDRKDTGSEMPTTALDAGADAHLVQVLQMGRLRVTYDERPRAEVDGETVGQFLIIEDSVSGDGITMDLSRQGISIKTSYLLELVSDGLIDIKAMQVQINGRRVGNLPRQL